MTDWIHATVRLSMQSHDHPDTIKLLSARYRSPDDPQMLMCYAVRYRHKRYIEKVQINGESMFNPLLSAIYRRDYECLSLLLRTLNRDGRLLKDNKIAYWKGYGKFIDIHLLTAAKPVSVWEAIFQVDDPKALAMLSDYCLSEPQTLARLARHHGARKCFEVITNTRWQPATTLRGYVAGRVRLLRTNGFRPRAFKTGSTSLGALQQVVQRACSYQGLVTRGITEDALLMWDSLQIKGQLKFVTPTDEQQIDLLLSGDRYSLTQYCIREFRKSQALFHRNDDWEDGGNLHFRVILESWRHVLEKSVQENADDGATKSLAQEQLAAKFALSFKTLAAQNMFDFTDHIVQLHFKRCQQLLFRMTEMLLQNGANMIQNIQFRFDWLNLDITMCVYLRMLVTYHYKLFYFERWGDAECTCYLRITRRSESASSTGRVILSLLPQHVYEAYRLTVIERQQQLENERKKDVPDVLRIFILERRLESAHDTHAPRSLLELCRLTLYQNTPTGKLPQLVQDEEIPRVLKRYLTLGVFPKYYV